MRFDAEIAQAGSDRSAYVVQSPVVHRYAVGGNTRSQFVEWRSPPAEALLVVYIVSHVVATEETVALGAVALHAVLLALEAVEDWLAQRHVVLAPIFDAAALEREHRAVEVQLGPA